MGTVRKTITLTQQQNDWIAEQIAGGAYTNDSEAIRDLIRREQERRFEIETIRQALVEGEQSGEAEPFDFAAFKQRKAVRLKPSADADEAAPESIAGGCRPSR